MKIVNTTADTVTIELWQQEIQCLEHICDLASKHHDGDDMWTVSEA